MSDLTKKTRENNLKTLRPRKYTEQEFFIADEVEIVSFRDELASMEHPFFSLKACDTKVREYQAVDTVITVRPSAEIGLATVFDKDVWIYAISKLQQAIFEGQSISSTVVFTPYEFFKTTNRGRSGKSYDDLKKTLRRLKGTTIETNISHDGDKKTKQFGIIEDWEVVEKKKGMLDVGMVKVKLPDWLYQAITQTKVLKISPDYFLIRKAIDRRLYEIARKHCGYKQEFSLSLERLHLKTGSTSSKAEFKRLVKKLCATNDLPDYEVFYDPGKDAVTFLNRYYCPKKEQEAKNRTAKNNVAKQLDGLRQPARTGRKRDINEISQPDSQIPKGFRG